MIKEINIHQEREWKKTVQQSLEFDSYHTWEYHNLTNDGIPVLLVYHENDDFIAFPLLKRSIPNTIFFDMTSVYGYTGPISNRSFSEIPKLMMDNFKREILQYFKQNRIVSVFSRLNPFLNQMPLMSLFQGIHENGNGVVINLEQSLDEQRARYESTLLKQVRKVQNMGFSIEESKSDKAIHEFSEIYTENMKRVGASNYYMFSEDFFRKFLSSMEFHSKLFLVYYQGEAVCGAIILFTKNIIQSHLACTKTAFLRYSPAKFLTDEICQFGRKLGVKCMNLGGGLGFKKDSLFDFKSSFSDIYYDYKTWRYISDPENYLKLLLDANINPDNSVDFFPLYRCPKSMIHEMDLSFKNS